jgi:hypothetical protein
VVSVVAVVSVGVGGVVVSSGWAFGAIILSEMVAVGIGPVVGLGFNRCIWSSHFITVNPTTRTTTPIMNGQNDPRPPLLGAARRRTTVGRTGSGSGASWRYE